jgi:hypothetical protein
LLFAGCMSLPRLCHYMRWLIILLNVRLSVGQVGAKTTQGLLQLIRAERNGDTVNRLLLAHLLRMLTALGIYQTAFQASCS